MGCDQDEHIIIKQKDLDTNGWGRSNTGKDGPPPQQEGGQTNQMKIIGQQNEALGNISLSHDQLMTILSSKTEGGIVTIHFQSEEGTINPVQLQIVPEDQLFQSTDETGKKFPKNNGAPSDANCSSSSQNKVAPSFQMTEPDMQDLILREESRHKIKSIVFKQVKQEKEIANCITQNPDLSELITRKPYFDLKKDEFMRPLDRGGKKGAQYKCSRCEKGFTTPGNLKRHILNIHVAGQGQNGAQVCQYCKKTYSRADYLAQHIRNVHEQSRRHVCASCGKNFTQKGSLTRHVKSVHMNVKEFECKLCDYSAVSYNDLKKHAAMAHFNRSRFECTICGFAHWSANIVKNHTLAYHTTDTHVDNRKCRYCGITVKLSKESFTLHVAACKTMQGIGRPSKRKKKGGMMLSEGDNNLESLFLSEDDCGGKDMSFDSIPWNDMIQDEGNMGEEEGVK